MTTIGELERKIRKIEKRVYEISEVVGISPPFVRPLGWDGLTTRDVEVLTFLINEPRSKRFTTTEIAAGISLPNPSVTGRVHVYNSLKRIQRIARRKRQRILDHDRKRKTYALNRFDFMYQTDTLAKPPHAPS